MYPVIVSLTSLVYHSSSKLYVAWCRSHSHRYNPGPRFHQLHLDPVDITALYNSHHAQIMDMHVDAQTRQYFGVSYYFDRFEAMATITCFDLWLCCIVTSILFLVTSTSNQTCMHPNTFGIPRQYLPGNIYLEEIWNWTVVTLDMIIRDQQYIKLWLKAESFPEFRQWH